MMEVRSGGLQSEVYAGWRFRNKREYVRDLTTFNSFMDHQIRDSGFDPDSRVIAGELIHDCFDFSMKGLLNKVWMLSALEPGFPHTTPREKVGTALFYATGMIIDDIIDAPDFPGFFSPADFKRFLWEQKFQPRNSTTNYSVEELVDSAKKPFSPRKQEIISQYFNSAVKAHWESDNHNQPGTYGYQPALDYRVSTTVDGVRVARKLVNLPYVNDNPMLAGQLLDDALDMISDARDGSINLWLGLATETGEIDVILREMNEESRIPELVRGRIVRRRMPVALGIYKKIYEEESESKWSEAARQFHRALAVFI